MPRQARIVGKTGEVNLRLDSRASGIGLQVKDESSRMGRREISKSEHDGNKTRSVGSMNDYFGEYKREPYPVEKSC